MLPGEFFIAECVATIAAVGLLIFNPMYFVYYDTSFQMNS